MIEAQGLSKVYGSTTAVDGVTFTVRPGVVTGFLGPNGAGKSTTMRMIMGLDRPSGGSVTVNGRPYVRHRSPLTEVGALLEARAVHPGRTARAHLRALAATHGLADRRVDEVVELTGLGSVARKRVGGFSLGMGQRLGIAVALLGDPRTLVLDEPVNGLDPEGVLWVRHLARRLAAEGRTVFLSSHLMTEMALTADHVIVIGRGRILADAPVRDVVEAVSRRAVTVRTPGPSVLRSALEHAGATITVPDLVHDGTLEVTGLDAAAVGEIALTAGVALHELTPVASTLEDAYLELTADAVEYRTDDLAAAGSISPTTTTGDQP
ncbi:ABC transporter ATP-binding protein [Krasilnikoviella flava]|uniref:ABC-2 type transport system ATP-binding protein n=1 Tax=Krasilnikoviella flava TaxID=526729 RepID=A0A1T5LQP5_9MICO|nr:ATP-binding cassette domain-containing protein [Krasilnikoviella flava]SKC78347.1 ABC-2 type transport system ATP-binding protein [Krasilnikoviella flava]